MVHNVAFTKKNTKKMMEMTRQFMNQIFTETGLPVLIYDEKGYIIQATDPSRIGDLHAGAKQIMDGLVSEYAVTSKEARATPLVKEGYSCPIVYDGTKIGGFGITGPLSIAKPLARVASRMMKSWIGELNRQEQLEASEKQYRSIFDNSVQGIFRATFEGKLLVANKALSEMIGYDTPKQLISNIDNLSTQLYVDPARREELISRLIRDNQVKGFIARYRHKKGHIIDVSISAHVISDTESGTCFFEGIVDDITSKIKAEQLKIERDAAKAANEAKSRFLANMSHEIRTPMNGVIGMSELLLTTRLTPEQLEFAQTIQASGNALLSLINDILDYSKIEAGKLDLETIDFDLRVTLDSVGDLMAIKAQEKGLEYVTVIHPDVPSLLKGDPGRLRQILLNLTGNAVKFTQKGEIVIYVDPVKESKTRVSVKFRITDTGIGIPPEKMNLLFKSFSQVDTSTTRKYGGTGLGLTISKKLARMMNGETGVSSRDGEGSEFWFTARFEKQPVKEKPIALSADIRNRYILIVDDNKTNRFVLREQLKRWGCRYDEAEDGFEAIEKLTDASQNKTPFDIALVDMQMPGFDGKDLGKQIKRHPDMKETRLIMMSSMGERGDVNALKRMGFDAYLTKPVKKAQLHACLVKVYHRKKSGLSQESQNVITQYSLSDDERRRLRILLAEDNRINQKVALKILNKLGYRADSAMNGREAILNLEKTAYDLVLMDCQMPELDGYEATKKIRRFPSGSINAGIPIIAMTAHAMKGDREKCLRAGMNDYLPKPFKPADLSEMLDKWLKNRGRQQA